MRIFVESEFTVISGGARSSEDECSGYAARERQTKLSLPFLLLFNSKYIKFLDFCKINRFNEDPISNSVET